jgi:hypothetical protein
MYTAAQSPQAEDKRRLAGSTQPAVIPDDEEASRDSRPFRAIAILMLVSLAMVWGLFRLAHWVWTLRVAGV